MKKNKETHKLKEKDIERNKRLIIALESRSITPYRVAKILEIPRPTMYSYTQLINEVPNLLIWSLAWHLKINPNYILSGQMPMYLDDEDLPVMLGQALEINLIGSISAGTPTESWEQNGKIIIPSAFFEGNAVVVQGSKMEAFGFFDGDVAILEPNLEKACESKKYLAYSLPEEADIIHIRKCYAIGKKSIKLELRNDRESDTYTPNDIIIHGIVIGLLRKF